MAAPAAAQMDVRTYMHARAAEASGDANAAVAAYRAALSAHPDDTALALRAYRQALVIGDYALAQEMAAVLAKGEDAQPDTYVLTYATALKAQDLPAMKRALAELEKGSLAFLVPTISAWMALEHQMDMRTILENARKKPISGHYLVQARPLMLLAAGAVNDAIVSLSTLPDSLEYQQVRLDAAELLLRRGERTLAEGLVDPQDFAIARKLAGQRKQIDLTYGVSRLLLNVVDDLAEQDVPVLSIALARAALLLDPDNAQLRLRLAETLIANGNARIALAELDQVKRDSPYRREAQAIRVAALEDTGALKQALDLAASISAKGDAQDARAYAELLVADGQYTAGAKAFGTALSRPAGRGDWELHYLRGVALDRADDWSKAAVELRRALAIKSDAVEALEYLGKGLVARGSSLDEAQALLERANRLAPEDSDVAASLGEAYLVRGNVDQALPLLEKAVRGDPGGARPNEHLGDVYWKSGRQFEARYAWKAAALYADAEQQTRLQNKIAHGIN